MGALWDYFTGAQQAESDRLDAARIDLNNRRAAIYGGDWLARTQANDLQTSLDDATAREAVVGELTPQKLLDNLAVSSGEAAAHVRSFADSVLSFPLKSIPPIGWILIAGALFIYLGGHVWLRGVIPRKLT